MRSRDRQSRLASSTPRHPDFFNLYHSPFHHPLDDPPASAFSLFQAILQFAILTTYLDRHLSPRRKCHDSTAFCKEETVSGKYER